jgi:tetratricopeptide (TPR) repeat protein
MPLPYPHRISFLASSMTLPSQLEHLVLLPAKLLACVLFDHFLRHPIVTVGDFDDERLTGDDDRLLDARSAGAEEAIDWFFRVSRRHEVLWLDVSLDPQRPAPVRLRARRPTGPIEEWASIGQGAMSEQIAQVLDLWLENRRLPLAGPMTPFSVADLHEATLKLDRALVAGRPTDDDQQPTVPEELLSPPARLGAAFFRVMADMAPVDAGWDERILQVDPTHPVARRNLFLASLGGKDADRRAILPVVEECPMYGKPHLSVHGEAFDEDRPDEGMDVRHQGIAASLIPANPYACHNYSLQLADEGRYEEAYRWADRATIASPSFNSGHLDCVRRLRQIQRPGQAFAEAQFRCNDLQQRWDQGRISPFEWPAKYHAGMLLAFAHFDLGRLDEAIHIAEQTMADMDDPEGGHESFAWALKRIKQWKSDPKTLASAYGWEGYHRGDPGRVIDGLALGDVDDADEVWMLVESLIAIGREDLARVAFHHYLGAAHGRGIVGDAKGRLAGARAEILVGDPHLAIEQLLIVQSRRPQGRLEAEINRLLRLAACRPADDWEPVVGRLLDKGAPTLARRAARDLADFIPAMDRPVILRALGDRPRLAIDPQWMIDLAASLGRLGPAAAAVDERLAPPADATLASADLLAQEWWTVLPTPVKDRDAHAAAAVYALGVALARYLAATTEPPSPIAGAYRHIATEALHLVRRARYHVDDEAVRGLLEMLEHCAGVETWLFDTWLLRVEHALDLDNEYGAYLPALTAGLPRVTDLLRGDERIGWELRLAWDLRNEPDQLDPARVLYERCARALETGATEVEWSNVADATLPPAQALDVHWTATIANPTNHAEPWVNLARALFAARRGPEAFDALCRAFVGTGEDWRSEMLATFEDTWANAGLDIPFGFDQASSAGLAALQAGNLPLAERCFRWCRAQDPKNGVIAKNLGIVYGAMGRVHDAVRAFAGFEVKEAGKHAGTALMQAKNYDEAVIAFRYASPRFTTADDWRLLAVAAWYAENDAVSAMAYEKMLAAGFRADNPTLHGLASGLYNTGQWVKCEAAARQLLDLAGGDKTYRSLGLHAMARAFAGQGKFGDALRVALEAQQMNPLPDNKAELDETVRLCQAQQIPPFKTSPETSVERAAFDALASGDMQLAEELATHGNSWGLFRAALASSEFRYESDNNVPVPGKALEAARMVLERTVGNPLPDATLARIRALRMRENAFIQIDPPPPLGARMRREDFARAFAARSGDPIRVAPVAVQPSGIVVGDGDPTVFPGTSVAKLSDYVALMKSMQSGDMMGALNRAGLDMAAYMKVATQWGQKLATDSTLNARYTQMMQR